MQIIYFPTSMKTRKLPPVPEKILRAARYAQPPGKRPKGYFDNLVTITKTLLDQGLKLCHAADFLIREGQLKAKDRKHFHDAMRGRLSRLQQRNARSLVGIRWQASLFFDSVHGASEDGITLCGAKASGWMDWNGEGGDPRKCSRCVGIARRQKVEIPEP